ncbi:MAG: hypothetical protein M1378_11370 [Bacteroidetes bacterium]|nr:hypothetical protein [Bacteroidota bacterium]
MVTILSPDGKRRFGEIYANVLCKTVKGSKHRLNHPPAWAIAELAIERAKTLGVTEVHILDAETDLVYSAKLEDVENGFKVQRGGFEPQRGLALSKWTVTKHERENND